jgi:hypothetical protein
MSPSSTLLRLWRLASCFSLILIFVIDYDVLGLALGHIRCCCYLCWGRGGLLSLQLSGTAQVKSLGRHMINTKKTKKINLSLFLFFLSHQSHYTKRHLHTHAQILQQAHTRSHAATTKTVSQFKPHHAHVAFTTCQHYSSCLRWSWRQRTLWLTTSHGPIDTQAKICVCVYSFGYAYL